MYNSVAESLAREAEFQLVAEKEHGLEFFWIWEAAEPAVVLGRSSIAAQDVDQEACNRVGVPVVRRESGGGTVLLGPGCLNYTLILSLDLRPQLSNVSASYDFILGAVAKAAAVGGAGREGTDLTLGNRKFGGSSQRRRQRTVLHHGTILYDFSIEATGYFLRQPLRQPSYRANRSHHEFLTNVRIGPMFRSEMSAQFAGAQFIE